MGNMYDVIARSDLHGQLNDLDAQYIIVGGLGLHAVTNAEKIDWDERAVTVSNDTDLPRLRENGTIRDLDTLVCSTDARVIDKYKETIVRAIGGEVVASVFGLRRYEENTRGFLDFTGSRYSDDKDRLFWRLSGIETQLPRASLDPWQIKRDDEVICNILNPVAQLGAYMNRSITGIRPKDEKKVDSLRQVIMPHGKIGDIPKDYLNQYYAFSEQYLKVASERSKMGLIALKSCVLPALERNGTLVGLAQGKLDGILSIFTGKQ